jgi:hypothetical protein
MKKLFTKYLFFVFLFPILALIIFYFLSAKDVIGTYGVNRTINFGGSDIDAILSNPIYTISFFYSSYAIYLLGYFIVFLAQRSTNLFYSLINLILFGTNYFLLVIDTVSKILIPLSVIGIIIFIFNIFKTTKKPSTINQQPSTI